MDLEDRRWGVFSAFALPDVSPQVRNKLQYTQARIKKAHTFRFGRLESQKESIFHEMKHAQGGVRAFAGEAHTDSVMTGRQ